MALIYKECFMLAGKSCHTRRHVIYVEIIAHWIDTQISSYDNNSLNAESINDYIRNK
jgi:hypothetical protein